MAQDIVSETQNLSYTNQDFTSIYPEVLNMIKQLTYKWDPSISDESDPGVILVKLSALIADKCNYNIDKSILEAFPLSVTQDSNARQLYEQLGYYMDWYESAHTEVALTYISKEKRKEESFTIPRFTIICDNESMHNYTLVGVEGSDGLIVSDTILTTDGKPVYAIAYEGTPVQYTYQSESVITPRMVDPITRRLYFSSAFVSQNGVFINNVNQENYSDWKRVNNIYEQSYDELRYMFGYDSRSNLCYIEFPDNYSELIGAGIEITYLIIEESYKDIPSRQLVQFLVPVRVRTEDDSYLDLNSNYVDIKNYTPSTGHKDKESINDAYSNYKRTVGTFNTLITLRDYLNFIRDREKEICSNAFVCDRTNDIQSTYKIMSRQNDIDTLIVKVEQVVNKTKMESTFEYRFTKSQDDEIVETKMYYKVSANNELKKIPKKDLYGSPKENGWYELVDVEPEVKDALTPFSLKFYLLRNAISLNSGSAYNETFNMMYESPDIDALLEDTAHLEHTREDILPLGEDTYKKSNDKSFLDTKSYYLYSPEYETYTLMTEDTIASGTITFDPVDADLLPQDSIKNPVEEEWFEDIEGEKISSTDTFAIVGKTEGKNAFFIQANALYKKQYPVDAGWYEYNSSTGEYTLSTDKTAVLGKMYYAKKVYFSMAVGSPAENPNVYELDIEALLPHTVFFKNVYPLQFDISTYEALNVETQTIIMRNVIIALLENTNSKEIDFGEEISLEYLANIVENCDDRIRTVSFHSLDYTTKAIYYDKDSQSFVEVELDDDLSVLEPENYRSLDSVLKARFKKDILAKSILAGTSQLIIPDSTFTYHLSHKFITFTENVKEITSEAIIDFGEDDAMISYASTEEGDSLIRRTYTLKDNETITLFRPSLTTTKEFLRGANFEYLFFNDVYENQSYELTTGEYMIFYLPDTNDSGVIRGYNAYAFGAGTIIRPGFDIVAQNQLEYLTKYARNRIIPYFETHSGETEYDAYTNNNTYMTEIRNSSNIENNSIPNSKSVVIQELNNLTITTEDKYKFFWALSEPRYSNEENIKTFVLFDEVDSSEETYEDRNTYTLKSGEYLYYTDSEEKDFFILGPGTTLTRNCGVESGTNGYDKVYTSLYFKNCELLEDGFQYITDREGRIIPSASGLYEVTNPVPYIIKDGDVNPTRLSLYEEIVGIGKSYYDLTEDTSFISGKDYYTRSMFTRSTDDLVSPGKAYYVLLEYKLPGWVRRSVKILDDGTEEYVYSADGVTAPAFDVVILGNNESLFNPKEKGYYEKVLYNNQPIEDVYRTNESQRPTSHSRYATTTKTSILTRNILNQVPDIAGWDISDLGTYDTIPGYIFEELPSSGTLNLKAPIYKIYYKEEGGEFIPIENVDYLSRPNFSEWLEWSESKGDYQRTADITPKILDIKNTSDVSIIKEVAASYDMEFYNKGYFFVPNSYVTAKFFDVNKTSVGVLAGDPTYSRADSSPLDTLRSKYGTISEEYSGGSKWIDALSSPQNWGTDISYDVPKNWAVPKMTDKSEDRKWTIPPTAEEVQGKYIKVKASQITIIDFDVCYPAFTYDDDEGDTTFLDADFYIPAKWYTDIIDIDPTVDPLYYYELDKGYVYLDLDVKLCRLFPKDAELDLSKYQIFYLPKLYRAVDLVAYTPTKFYKEKDLFTRNFGKIDAWSCTAIDNNSIADDPLGEIGDLWTSLQYNTSLTITESELWSFATGDSVIIETEETSDTALEWPEFSNQEVAIDTERFNLLYQRSGSDIVALDNLNVEGYSWKGYSSLLLNTSNSNGQKLYSNQSITLYEDNSTDPILEISGSPDYDIIFQLKYPVANVSGAFIDVSVINTLGESVLNSIYIFRALPNGDYYKYTTDVYDTYLYFNSYLPDPESNEIQERSPRSITIPACVPWGHYLLPVASSEKACLYARLTQTTTVAGELIDINMIATDNITAEGRIKIGTSIPTLLLHSFVDKERTEFIGDQMQFLQLDLDRYCKINVSSFLSEKYNLSPFDLNWMERDAFGDYITSTDTRIGADLIEEINKSSTKDGDSPVNNGWYERDSDGNYSLSMDDRVDPEATYYKDKEFFVPISMVDSNIEFYIKDKTGTKEYTDAITYIIKDIFRYSNNPEFSDDSFDVLFNQIRRLDPDEDYNFTFVPNPSDLINNPLTPSSFWNKNHIFNNFIIGQALLDEEHLDYKFTNNK